MIDALTTLLSSPMMQRSLLAALIVGLTAHPATLPWPCCSTAASPAASS